MQSPFLITIELTLAILIIWAIVTQIINPVRHGRPLFPMFSRKDKLNSELARVREAQDESRLESILKREKANLK